LLLGFLVGGMTISVSIGVAIVGSLRGSGAAPGPKPATKPVVDIAVGTLGWIRGHAREIVIWLAATVGVWLVVKGIVAAV
jgi:hypothetical protein